MPNDRRSLLKMGKRPLTSAPPLVPLETLENEFLNSEEQSSEADASIRAQSTSSASQYDNVSFPSPKETAVQPAVQLPKITADKPAAETASQLTDVQLAVQTAVQADATDRIPGRQASKNAGTKLVPRSGRKRVLTVSATFRLPEELHTRLKRISQYNQIDMTDITVEALELHLTNFSDPG